jgi:hypothetical protein
MTFGEQAGNNPSTMQPTLIDQALRTFPRLWRRCAILSLVIQDEQRSSRRSAETAHLVEHLGPKLRHEATLVDFVDDLGVHDRGPPPNFSHSCGQSASPVDYDLEQSPLAAQPRGDQLPTAARCTGCRQRLGAVLARRG